MLHDTTLTSLRPRVRSGGSKLWLRVVEAVLALAGEEAAFETSSDRPWASAMFQGSRHTVRLRFCGPDGADAAERFAEALPEHEFCLAGQLVADAQVIAFEHRPGPAGQVVVEAQLLLLEES